MKKLITNNPNTQINLIILMWILMIFVMGCVAYVVLTSNTAIASSIVTSTYDIDTDILANPIKIIQFTSEDGKKCILTIAKFKYKYTALDTELYCY